MPLSQALKDRIVNEFFPKYPTKRAALTMALWLAQDEQGWLSLEACEERAEVLELDPMDVRAVASFSSLRLSSQYAVATASRASRSVFA